MSKPCSRSPLAIATGLAFGLCSACAGSQPASLSPGSQQPSPGETAEAVAGDQESAPSSGQAPEPAVTPGPTQPYAKVIEILPGRDEPEDRRARIELFNPTSGPCRFQAYTMRWADSSKEMPLGNLEIAAGNSRQRFLIVHPHDGDIEALSAQGATIELQVECGP